MCDDVEFLFEMVSKCRFWAFVPLPNKVGRDSQIENISPHREGDSQLSFRIGSSRERRLAWFLLGFSDLLWLPLGCFSYILDLSEMSQGWKQVLGVSTLESSFSTLVNYPIVSSCIPTSHR